MSAYAHADLIQLNKIPNPALRYPKNKISKNRLVTISRKLEEKLLVHLDSLPNKQHKDFFIFLMDTGSRNLEARSLEWRNVFLDKREILLYKVKNGPELFHPMTERVHVMLTRRYKNRINEYVFEGSRSVKGQEISHRSYHRTWLHEAVEAVTGKPNTGDERITGHTCRHTYATRLISKNVPLYSVSKWLGHASIKETERYAHFQPNESDVKAILSALAGNANLGLINGIDMDKIIKDLESI